MKTQGIRTRVIVFRRERGMLYAIAMSSAVQPLLAAQQCRENARLLAGCVRSGHDHCESCDGAGRGTSVYGEWICSSCHGYGTRKGAA